MSGESERYDVWDAPEAPDPIRRIAKLEEALGNIVRFDRGDTSVARGCYGNLISDACAALGGKWANK